MSNCCQCSLSPIGSSCRASISTADLATLVYVEGLDENLCEKFQAVADLLQLTDCEDNLIAFDTPIVTCAEFQTVLCQTLALLASGGSLALGVTQVIGADCLTYTVPETPIIAVDSSCIDLVTSGAFDHTIRADLVISNAALNSAICIPDGLYVPSLCSQVAQASSGGPLTLGVTEVLADDCAVYTVPETPITPVDTLTVDLTVSGAFDHTVQADVRIDPDGIIEVTVDGLLVSCAAVAACVPATDVCAVLAALPFGGPATPGVTALVGSDCVEYTIPASAAETPITPIDTNSVDLTVSGAGSHTIKADVIIDPDVSNILTLNAAGLFVPDTNVTGIDTSCINITVNEPTTHNFTVEAAPVISPDLGNQLVCQGNGLFVPPSISEAVVQAADTSCINMTVTESPADTFTVSAVPIISALPGNQLVCVATGLYSPDTNVLAADTASVNTTVTEAPADTFTVSSVVIVADAKTGYPAGCNGIAIQAGGIAAPPDIAGSYDEDNTDTGLGIVPFVAGQIQFWPTAHIDIVNPSACRSATLQIVFKIPSISTENAVPDPNSYMLLEVWIKRNLPGFFVDGVFIKYTGFNINTNGRGGGSPPAERSYTMVVPPSFAGDFEVFTVLQQIAGDQDSVSLVAVNGAYYTLNTI